MENMKNQKLHTVGSVGSPKRSVPAMRPSLRAVHRLQAGVGVDEALGLDVLLFALVEPPREEVQPSLQQA